MAFATLDSGAAGLRVLMLAFGLIPGSIVLAVGGWLWLRPMGSDRTTVGCWAGQLAVMLAWIALLATPGWNVPAVLAGVAVVLTVCGPPMAPSRRTAASIGLVIITLAAIGVLGLLNNIGVLDRTLAWISNSDKTNHLMVGALTGLLVAREAVVWRVVWRWIVLALVVALGLAGELLQWLFTERAIEAADVLHHAGGASVGLALAMVYELARTRRATARLVGGAAAVTAALGAGVGVLWLTVAALQNMPTRAPVFRCADAIGSVETLHVPGYLEGRRDGRNVLITVAEWAPRHMATSWVLDRGPAGMTIVHPRLDFAEPGRWHYTAKGTPFTVNAWAHQHRRARIIGPKERVHLVDVRDLDHVDALPVEAETPVAFVDLWSDPATFANRLSEVRRRFPDALYLWDMRFTHERRPGRFAWRAIRNLSLALPENPVTLNSDAPVLRRVADRWLNVAGPDRR